MSEMSEIDLLKFLDSAQADAVKYNGEFMQKNEELLDYYFGNPYGDEVEGQSQAISTDVADVIEADMPSLARIFLGSHDILEFTANTNNKEEEKEAEEKTKYINWLVRNQPTSFKTIHDWLKNAEIQKFGAVKFYMDEQETPDEKTYKGLSADELALLEQDFKSGKGKKFEVISKEKVDDAFNVKFRITTKKKKVVVQSVPVEDFIISRNATCKDKAELVGDIYTATRGQLIAQGFDKEKVALIPKKGQDANSSRMKDIRFADQGGYVELTSTELNEEVQIYNLFPLVDFDGDGIPERRNIVRGGPIILQNEAYGIVPYAIFSTILMPDSAIGRSRAEITKPTQYIKSHLYRQILNNIYQVNKPRTAIDDSQTGGVDMDDLLTQRLDGIVRCSGNPYEKIMPLVTPYIGDKALQVVQYIDFARAQSTGSLMASQGLSIDDLHKETATRFEGVQDASEAKIELVARVLAETGFRELYEGLAWLVSHYQDEATEIRILGKPLTVDPRKWRYEHYCVSNVGLGAGDTQEILQNMSGVLTIQQQLMAIQSPLVDSKKVYNTAARIIKAMGLSRVSDYFNDPEQPEEILLAQNEILKQAVQGLQAQLQNPLAEAEKIKAQAKIMVDGAKQQGDLAIEEAKQRTDMNKFLLTFTQKQDEFRQEMIAKLTELELKYKQGSQSSTDDIPGSLV